MQARNLKIQSFPRRIRNQRKLYRFCLKIIVTWVFGRRWNHNFLRQPRIIELNMGIQCILFSDNITNDLLSINWLVKVTVQHFRKLGGCLDGHYSFHHCPMVLVFIFPRWFEAVGAHNTCLIEPRIERLNI